MGVAVGASSSGPPDKLHGVRESSSVAPVPSRQFERSERALPVAVVTEAHFIGLEVKQTRRRLSARIGTIVQLPVASLLMISLPFIRAARE
jgi:hypothetical protein